MTEETWRSPLRSYCLSLLLLALMAIAFRVYALKPILAPIPRELAPESAALSAIMLPLMAIAAAVLSQFSFSSIWARLSATLFGAAAVLYLVGLPEIWSIANIAEATCSPRHEALPAICLNLAVGLTNTYAMFLLTWSYSIVLPIVTAVTFVHAWLLLLGSVSRGVIARLRGA